MKTVLLTMRVPEDVIERADALVPAVSADPSLRAAAGRVTRSTVLRLAIERGLAALEAEHGATPAPKG